MEKLYKVQEVAEMLNLSISCIYKKAEKGEIAGIKIGSALRFSASDIQAFVKKCKIPNESKSDKQTPPAFINAPCFL